MKILAYFNSMAPAGGIERVISKHIQFLETEHEVVLVTNDRKPSFYSIPLSVNHESIDIELQLDMHSRLKRIFQVGFSFLKTSYRLRKKIREHKPDIIYLATPLSLLEVFLATLSCKSVLMTEHSSFSAYNLIYRSIVLTLYKRVKLLTVPTNDDSGFYLSKGIKNTYLPNPVSFFPEVHAPLENKIVLNVGRLTDDKQHLLLITIWARTFGKNNGWQLKIIGQGENEQKIRALIKDLDLEESISLFPNTTKIMDEFCDASIFVLTSKAEGFGLVLAEAMACGVPCVSFNCPSGPKDIVADNINGFLIDEGDADEFCHKLDELMESNLLRKKFGLQARIDVKKFDENVISNKLKSLVSNYFE